MLLTVHVWYCQHLDEAVNLRLEWHTLLRLNYTILPVLPSEVLFTMPLK